LARRWFITGLLTSLGYLITELLLRGYLQASCASALAALVGTSIALGSVWWLTPRRPVRKDTPPLHIPPLAPERDKFSSARLIPTPVPPPPLPRPEVPPAIAAQVPSPEPSLEPVVRPATDAPAQLALALPAAPTVPAAETEPGWVREMLELGFHGAVEEFKRQLLEEAIASCAGNRAEAARRLGLQRTYLYRLTKQLGASKQQPAASEA